MPVRSSLIALAACSLAGAAAQAWTIDGFEVAQSAGPGAASSSYVSGSGILGGERDVYLSDFPPTSSFAVSNGVLSVSQSSGFTDVFVTYDGADANPAVAMGLGGLNLLADGGNAFEVKLLATEAAAPHAHLWIRVYTSASNYSEVHLVLDANNFPSLLNIPFTTMSTNGAGADFSDVKAIQVELAIGSGIKMDLNIDYIAVVSPPTTIDFQSLQQSGSGFSNVGCVYAEKGFVFTDSRCINGLGSFQTSSPSYAGSTMLFNNTSSDTSLSREDGGEFDFVGIDLAKLQYPQSGPITFSGYRGSDVVVTETFDFNGSAGVQHFAPKSAFSKLTELRWPQQYPQHQFDNVQVRQNGAAGSGPQIRIGAHDSSSRLDLSRLRPGSGYVLQESADLAAWQDAYDFTAWSPTATIGRAIMPDQKRAFYRVLSVP
ncbi:MAG TPA: hypothetical protein VGC85_06160 [Chthoniobacterales bacterium]